MKILEVRINIQKIIKDNSFPFDYVTLIFRLGLQKIKKHERVKGKKALSIQTRKMRRREINYP